MSGRVRLSGSNPVSWSMKASAMVNQMKSAAQRRSRRAEAPRRRTRRPPGQRLDKRILGADARAARGALAAQYEPAHDRHVLPGADAVPARRARRARDDEVIPWLRRRLPGEFGALFAPAALEHLRQPVDDDVEERAHAKPEHQRNPGRKAG